jgi:hypothetical protein
MPKIRDLLARRTDLSTFVVHLSREYKSGTAQENLPTAYRVHSGFTRAYSGNITPNSGGHCW